jgi:hypothetical protein
MPTASLLEQEEKALRAKLQASEGTRRGAPDEALETRHDNTSVPAETGKLRLGRRPFLFVHIFLTLHALFLSLSFQVSIAAMTMTRIPTTRRSLS